MDPALPSILLWLQRTRDSYALEIMRLFDCASRAISYWGLQVPAVLKSGQSGIMLPVAGPGPLKDSIALANELTVLGDSFEAALDAFTGSAPEHFPSPSAESQRGISGAYYHLSTTERQTLQTQMQPSTNQTYYTVTTTLQPGILVDKEVTTGPDKGRVGPWLEIGDV